MTRPAKRSRTGNLVLLAVISGVLALVSFVQDLFAVSFGSRPGGQHDEGSIAGTATVVLLALAVGFAVAAIALRPRKQPAIPPAKIVE